MSWDAPIIVPTPSSVGRNFSFICSVLAVKNNSFYVKEVSLYLRWRLGKTSSFVGSMWQAQLEMDRENPQLCYSDVVDLVLGEQQIRHEFNWEILKIREL